MANDSATELRLVGSWGLHVLQVKADAPSVDVRTRLDLVLDALGRCQSRRIQ